MWEQSDESCSELFNSMCLKKNLLVFNCPCFVFASSMTQRTQESEHSFVSSLRVCMCGLPHIRANCQFINITPEKCIFERTHSGGARSSGRHHPFATLPIERESGGCERGTASWHAFHLLSDGCGKRWRWQCVLIAKSALLKPPEVGPRAPVTGLKARHRRERDFSPRCYTGCSSAMDHFDRDLTATSDRGLRLRATVRPGFYRGVFILLSREPAHCKSHADARTAKGTRRAYLSSLYR